MTDLNAEQLEQYGLSVERGEALLQQVDRYVLEDSPSDAWRKISQSVLSPDIPFEIHERIFQRIYADWNPSEGPQPAWIPKANEMEYSNIFKMIKRLKLKDYNDFHRWSITRRERYWDTSIQALHIKFKKRYTAIRSQRSSPVAPKWLSDARLNIADSCFQAPKNKVAIISNRPDGGIYTITYAELEKQVHQVANGLRRLDLKKGDAIAIDMAMTPESVAIYLAIVKLGAAAVSIADSFAPHEIKTRLKIAKAKAIFTQDVLLRGGKELPLYQKVVDAGAPMAIVLAAEERLRVTLRKKDHFWTDFLSSNTHFESRSCKPGDHTNILFSSGTTGDPKAIPWTQTTPIKAAVDAYYHHDVKPDDVLTWPTNLGWMMGPWLIYAGLINRACVALYQGAPTGRDFGTFVQDAKVTMLGLVPSLVKTWKASRCMQGLDWSHIRMFSSTGECSNAKDMLYLMHLAGYKPVIEYCGGTEVGGGYITGTVVQAASPGTFSTPALGLDFVLLDEEEKPCDNGEVFLIPPSIGLSDSLLNRNHYDTYFEGTPQHHDGIPLRRHGDQFERLGRGYYRAHGRVDDTMNLGGIKVSSAEIERVLIRIGGIDECAAIAVSPEGGGPSQLVIFAVMDKAADSQDLQGKFQQAIRRHLNPLFKVNDVRLIDSLPRTASNKVMRRVLRDRYSEKR